MHMVSKHHAPSLRPILGLFAFLLCTAHANAWWNSEWTLRRQLTVDATAAGAAADETARPVLFRLHDGNFQFPAAMDDGADIRFVAADDKTVLSHHVERYDSLLNEAFVWVNVPGLKAGAKVELWLYYGHEARTAPRTDDTKGTYDAGTALVYHFNGTGSPADLTKNANNATSSATAVQGSLIGPGLRFSGAEVVQIPESATLKRDAGLPLSFSAWVKPGAIAGRVVLLSWGAAEGGLEFSLNAGVPVLEVRNGSNVSRSPAGAPLTAEAWKSLAFSATSSAVAVYVDGVEYARVDASLPALSGPVFLGGQAGGKNGFVGEIDEAQISTVARSAGWLKLAAVAESGSSESQKVVVFGTEESAGGGGSSAAFEHVLLFGDIAKNMMFDGWIAVGCCCIMMVVAWVVALQKFAYLSKIEKGSAEFLRRWKLVSSDLTAIDHNNLTTVKSLGVQEADAKLQALMETSPLYHIYHIGSEEIRNRINSKNGFNGLSVRSITAIKASLDGGLTREVHQLNSGLVSLTIGIAGGPYVGLMGTVVGVMITFAVIAKTGQVEVNSIAPGIASALLATVFGLLVAIPALFLYSFLSSRIKNATSEMQLFIDEFITKMAEFYPVTAGTADSTTAPFMTRRRRDADEERQEAVQK